MVAANSHVAGWCRLFLDAACDELAAEGDLRLLVEALLIDAEDLKAQVVFPGVEAETQQSASSR